MSNCLSILTDVYLHQNKQYFAACSLISLLGMHFSVPTHWDQLGDVFHFLGNQKMSYYCTLRAKKLFEAVENTVRSIAHQKNLNEQKKLSEKLCNRRFEVDMFIDEMVDKAVFKRTLTVNKGDQNEDFVDLGSSKLRKMKEESLKNKKSKSISHPPNWMKNASNAYECIENFVQNCLPAK